MKIKNKNQGFTLIELVVVIVILGILAATAAPKFIDLQDDARTATLQAVEASLESASTLVHSKSLIVGNESVEDDADNTPTVTVNNITVDITFGYPLADYTSSAGDWTNLIELDANAFTSTVIDSAFVIYPLNGTAPTDIPADAVDTSTDTCFTFYRISTGANIPPVIRTIPCT